jgi:hypothetical protein
MPGRVSWKERHMQADPHAVPPPRTEPRAGSHTESKPSRVPEYAYQAAILLTALLLLWTFA